MGGMEILAVGIGGAVAWMAASAAAESAVAAYRRVVARLEAAEAPRALPEPLSVRPLVVQIRSSMLLHPERWVWTHGDHVTHDTMRNDVDDITLALSGGRPVMVWRPMKAHLTGHESQLILDAFEVAMVERLTARSDDT